MKNVRKDKISYLDEQIKFVCFENLTQSIIKPYIYLEQADLINQKNECPHVTKLAKFKLPICPTAYQIQILRDKIFITVFHVIRQKRDIDKLHPFVLNLQELVE